VVLPVSSATDYRSAFARLGMEVIEAAETPGAFEKSLAEHIPLAAEECIDPVLRCLRFAENAMDAAFRDFAAQLPEVHSRMQEVHVKEEDMAYAMRALIEEEDGDRKPEMIDGVKIVKDDGWVLIRPITDRPGLSVLSAGMNAEYARELTDLYTERIKNALRRR
jgi:phosphomannomutase